MGLNRTSALHLQKGRLLPTVLADFLRVRGFKVTSVDAAPETEHLPAGLTTGNLITNAHLLAA